VHNEVDRVAVDVLKDVEELSRRAEGATIAESAWKVVEMLL
jgi:hypothetical protein